MKFKKGKVSLILLFILTTGCITMKKTVDSIIQDVNLQNIDIVTEKEIINLPKPVQDYLRFSNIIGKEKIKTVRLKQGGGFRLKPDQIFKYMSAEQYFNVDSIGFYWTGKIGIVTAIDRFLNGKGDMKVKLFSFIKIASSDGSEIDQGALLRFLAEGVWFPSVFVEDFISWEALDDSSAKATIDVNDISASAIFYFNAKHEIERINAKRYMETDGVSSLEDWEIQIFEYKDFGGIRIPYKSHVIWKLDDGDFLYYKPLIYDIDFNTTEIY